MHYIVRLNQKAYNVVTKHVVPGILWEVEQVANKDSEKVIWHCGDVRIDQTPIREFFSLTPSEGKATWEYECFGICVRGQDNAIEIKTGRSDVSGH